MESGGAPASAVAVVLSPALVFSCVSVEVDVEVEIAGGVASAGRIDPAPNLPNLNEFWYDCKKPRNPLVAFASQLIVELES